MFKRLIILSILFVGSNCYAVGNPEFLENNIRGLQQALNSTDFGQKYRSQTDSLFDTGSLVVKNISNGDFDQANRLSADEMVRLKVEFARKLSEIDRSQWVSFVNTFNNISTVQLDRDEIIKLAERLRN
jgi:hypothetical protein